MLRSYLPAIVLLILGGVVGVAFAALNSIIGPRRDAPQKHDPYECGLPSEVQRTMRHHGHVRWPAGISAVPVCEKAVWPVELVIVKVAVPALVGA